MATKKKDTKDIVEQVAYLTNRPTGLTLSRSGSSFTGTWKIGDKDYKGGQRFQHYEKVGTKWTKPTSVSVAKTDTKKAFALNTSNYYPNSGKPKLTAVVFRVSGKRGKFSEQQKAQIGTVTYNFQPITSDWTEKKLDIVPPAAPSVSAALSDSLTNVCNFSWSATGTESGWLTRTQWQTVLVKDCTYTDGSKAPWKSTTLGWATGTTGSTGSQTITEDTSLIAGKSYTRWFRVRSQGVAGDSAWKYSKHVYAAPNQATVKTVTPKVTPGGYLVTVKWQAEQNAARPIDSTTIQYAIATPLANRVCPPGASWRDADVQKDTAKMDGATFAVDSRCGFDEILYTRVNTKHDNNITYGSAVYVKGGLLTAPTGLTISADDTTHRATITATNESAVPDSFLVVSYITAKNPNGIDIGIIPHGSTSVTVQCPAWATGEAIRFGVRAVQGTYNAKTRADGVTVYDVTKRLWSTLVTDGGAVPVAPTGVTVTASDIPGTIRVAWNWTWSGATAAELSWADHADAWESTDMPETFEINNTHASAWNISGLETGVTWYVRVRLMAAAGDDVTYGAYSEMVSIDLSSAPVVPSLTLSEGVIPEDGSVVASWAYSTTDGTMQASAQLAEVVNGAYVPLLQVETQQTATIYPEEMGWSAGETHYIVVQVASASGRISDGWSDPVALVVAERITASITATSLEPQTIVVDGVSRNINALTAMPLSVTVSGAGQDGTTTVAIERAADYHVARPDESTMYGYEGETVALVTQLGDAAITITADDLLGRLDDGAAYRIVATVEDAVGQTATDSLAFEVHWTHQAIIPAATVEIDEDAMVAKLTPVAPTGTQTGDTCDIYRLSVDKPVLVYPNAEFGTTYVDPFPTIGDFGGHRFVFHSKDGDYITADNEFAWVDTTAASDGDYLDLPVNVIDFGAGRVVLTYDIDLANSWTKDFIETQYLGGAVQGDWNPAVKRSATLSAVSITAEDQTTIEAMRRLAEHPGICHVRTKDGSSYAADVQCSETYKHDNNQRLVTFQLKITRVDPEGYDGMTLAEWEQTQQEDEE